MKRALGTYALLCVALVVSWFLGDPDQRAAVQLAVTLVSAVAMGLGAATLPPGRRHPFALVGGGLAAYAVSGVLGSSMALAGAPAVKVVAVLLECAAYLSVGTGALRMLRSLAGDRDLAGVIDAAIVVTAGVALLLDTTAPGIGTGATRFGVFAHLFLPLVLLGSVALAVRMLRYAGPTCVAVWLVVLGGFFAAAAAIVASLTGDAMPGPGTGVAATDFASMLGMALAGASPLHPSVHTLAATHVRPAPDDQPMRRWLLALGLAAGPGVMLARSVQSGDGVPASGAGALLISVLVLWRLSRIERGRRAAVERQQALVRLGALALQSTSSATHLHREVADLLGTTVGRRCKLVTGDAVAGQDQIAVPAGRDGDEPVTLLIPDELPTDEREFVEAMAGLLRAAHTRRHAEAQARHQALHDPLTGLPNRAQLLCKATDALLADDPAPVRLLFIDLDGFKAVNDTHGHAVGDRVLQTMATRLALAVDDAGLLARFAGDEFVVLTRTIPGGVGKATGDATDVDPLVHRLATALAAPVLLDGRILDMDGSIGTATARPGEDFDDLLRRADAEMYRQKHRRRAVRHRAAPTSRVPSTSPAAASGGTVMAHP